jgi:hypothetical protein
MSIGTGLILVSFLITFLAGMFETKAKERPFPRNVTLMGWTLIGLAAVVGGLNYWQSRERATAAAIRENLGLRQLELSIYQLMTPYVALSDPPEMKDRFNVVEPYGKAGVFDALCKIDIAEEVRSASIAPEYEKLPWGTFITEKTQEALNRLGNIQAAYGQTFGDSMNSSIGEVINHPWNEFLLASKRRALRGGKRPLCGSTAKLLEEYKSVVDRYWPILSKLERSVGIRHCGLRKQLGYADAPPLFLRSISGLIFVPDPKVTEPIMNQVCASLTSGGRGPDREDKR